MAVIELVLMVGTIIAIITGVSVPAYILTKYLNSRKLREQISIAKVIISFAVWAFLSVCLLAAFILCAMAAQQSDQDQVSPWAVSAVFLGIILCYICAGFVIAYWLRRREEGIQTLSGRF